MERMTNEYISGWIEYNETDFDLLKNILGDTITEIRQTNWPACKAARFENMPAAIFDQQIVPLWGIFEWTTDGQEEGV
jgi:hypothetical protein